MTFFFSLNFSGGPQMAKMNLQTHSVSTYFSGIRKCRRDHSSLSEFCSGVPVMSSLWLDRKSIRVLYSSESSFLSRWASSTPRTAQFIFPSTPCTYRKVWLNHLWIMKNNSFLWNTIQVPKVKSKIYEYHALSFSRISYVVKSALNLILFVCWWIHS